MGFTMPEQLARHGQSLSDHLHETSDLAGSFGLKFGCPSLSKACGLLHDIGKFSRDFQDYLTKSLDGRNSRRGEVAHSIYGAVACLDKVDNYFLADCLANIIASHHGELNDMITDCDRSILGRIKALDATEQFRKIQQIDDVRQILSKIDGVALKREFAALLKNYDLKAFQLHLVVKALFSMLVDADRCNAAGIGMTSTMPDWEAFQAKLDVRLQKYGKDQTGSLHHVRTAISQQCFESANRRPGIYTLSVPTGGGKTLSSLRFAFEHAKINNMERVIYVIPFLSIIDQTAKELRDVLDELADGAILEHHSNFVLDNATESEEDHHNLLASRWDAPIILTTMVQFLETIYSNKASDLRKFHNMANSVIIFDEAQAVPTKCHHLFNGAVNFLCRLGKTTSVLCTATQPPLNLGNRAIELDESPQLVCISDEDNQLFKRTIVTPYSREPMSHKAIAELALEQIGQGISTLVILNTKHDAKEIFQAISESDCLKEFLSTDLYPVHRLEVINRIKENLKMPNGKPVLCVSTQLVEAGVDLSFGCVIRAMAGLDSIVQAAGRCNRHGELGKPGNVLIVEVEDEGKRIQYLPDIKTSQRQTRRIIDENRFEDITSEHCMDTYWKYWQNDVKNDLDYPIKTGDTVYALLGDNKPDKMRYESQVGEKYVGLPAAFKKAADHFKVIDANSIGVVVQDGIHGEEVNELVTKFINARDFKTRSAILKSLQPYTISVFANREFDIQQICSKVDETFYLLSSDHYDPITGLSMEKMTGLAYIG